ncbi:PLDc N-terminal domain-containing protein [Oscillospiraceae bacterium WX1]
MSNLSALTPYIPFLIPIAAVELGLLIAALISIFHHKTYRVGNRIIWIIVAVVFNIIGPILYFAIARGDE